MSLSFNERNTRLLAVANGHRGDYAACAVLLAIGRRTAEITRAVSFSLADGSDVADKTPPHGSRGWLRGYLQSRLKGVISRRFQS